MSDDARESGQSGGLFTTTHWSMVLAAGDSQAPGSREALSTLCEKYWYPVYAHVRRMERDPDTARDRTQEFFVHLLEKHAIKVATPERGRFRSFLVTTLRNYMSKQWRGERAQKRGGDIRQVAMDHQVSESRYILERQQQVTPEQSFDRRWARTLLRQTMERLRREMAGMGSAARFRVLERFLTGQSDGVSYGDVGEQLGITEDAVKTAVRRMRKRFGNILRAEVAETVDDPAAVDDEIRYLFSVLD